MRTGDEGASIDDAAERSASSNDVTTALADDMRSMDTLLAEAHLTAPHELPRLLDRHAGSLGAEGAVLYLADLQQNVLVPFLSPDGPGVDQQVVSLPINSTLAGRACQQLETMTRSSRTVAVGCGCRW